MYPAESCLQYSSMWGSYLRRADGGMETLEYFSTLVSFIYICHNSLYKVEQKEYQLIDHCQTFKTNTCITVKKKHVWGLDMKSPAF